MYFLLLTYHVALLTYLRGQGHAERLFAREHEGDVLGGLIVGRLAHEEGVDLLPIQHAGGGRQLGDSKGSGGRQTSASAASAPGAAAAASASSPKRVTSRECERKMGSPRRSGSKSRPWLG